MSAAYRSQGAPKVAREFALRGQTDKHGRIVVDGDKLTVEIAVERDAMGALVWGRAGGGWVSIVNDSLAAELIGL